MTQHSDGVSWSYSWSATTAQPETTRDLWVRDRLRFFPLSGNHLLVTNMSTKRSVAAPRQVVEALSLCNVFRTLDQHVDEIVRRLPMLGAQRGAITQALGQLRDQGFFVSAAQIAERLRGTSGDLSTLTAPMVAVRTCDRPVLLQRLMESLSENEHRFGGHYEYLVVDDSRGEDNCRRNRELIETVRRQWGMEVIYHGRAAQSSLSEQIKAALPAHRESTELLLDGFPWEQASPSPGRVMNHIVLLTAGRRVVLLDDDCVCRVRTLAGADESIEISRRDREPYFLSGTQDGPSRFPAADADPLQRHGEFLGYALATAAERLGRVIDAEALRYLPADDVRWVTGASRVLMTVNGTLGDPGTTSNRWLYAAEGAARERFFAEGKGYLTNRSQRFLFHVCPRFRFLPFHSLMTTTASGLDNRETLPPTFPRFRNEDLLFGALLQCIHPTTLALDFPWTLDHLPEPPRRWSDALLDRPAVPGVLHFMGDLATATCDRLHGQSWRKRLESVADVYSDLATAAKGEMVATAVEHALTVLAAETKSLAEALGEQPTAPPEWATDVQRMITGNNEAMRAPEQHILSDLQGSMAALRDILARFGQALTAWPELWAHAAERNARQ